MERLTDERDAIKEIVEEANLTEAEWESARILNILNSSEGEE